MQQPASKKNGGKSKDRNGKKYRKPVLKSHGRISRIFGAMTGGGPLGT
jgi:hypothetical protein